MDLFTDIVVAVEAWGLSQKLSRLIGIYRARELSLTGNFLDAPTARAWGLVNRVVPPQELMPTARRLAADMASASPGMLVAYKKLINDGFALPFGEAMALEHRISDERGGDAGCGGGAPAGGPGARTVAVMARAAALNPLDSW